MIGEPVFLCFIFFPLLSLQVGAEGKIGDCLACHQKETPGNNCASCHMYKGTHNISFGIVYDSGGNPVDKDGKPLSKEEQE